MGEDDVRDFFIDEGAQQHFHQVIAFHESPDLEWNFVSTQVPLMPRGWYELSRLSMEDRIEFTQEYWYSQLPSHGSLHIEKKMKEYFDNLEEIGIFATQSKRNGPFEVHMVYSQKGGAGFFQGGPPASEEAIESLAKSFGHITFPLDYLAFLRIHDGFSKYTDTGFIKVRHMAQTYQKLQHLLVEETLMRPDGQAIDPESLIPFYESFGLHSYQCFYSNWYPGEEMGNVFFSEHDRTISNYLDPESPEENLAFPSFMEWLVFYLEDIWQL